MMDAGQWIAQLEAEIARELGQPVTAALGGAPPDPQNACWINIELSAGGIALGADSADLADFLVEGRLIDRAQADDATVRELWRGILESVAARLGGRLSPGGDPPRAASAPCTLRMGEAAVRMALAAGAAEIPANRREEAEPPAVERAAPGAGNYDLLLEVELDASVRFGSRELELRELLDLGPGDVVELDRHLSDPVDLIVGDKIVARGEVVLVNGNFGLRVTEVATPMRRLESIRCLS
ncbi:MAG TPA: FliM/FliN family flagellar motor switch protein [Acidobacteriaceae bacterium]|jgi:flagellar motor switch protein FliN|nr:FliM/FliN family flagellar motor switch protein [Acidobacteriaceae bacterium]